MLKTANKFIFHYIKQNEGVIHGERSIDNPVEMTIWHFLL
jgi:hypothetical protein